MRIGVTLFLFGLFIIGLLLGTGHYEFADRITSWLFLLILLSVIFGIFNHEIK